MNYLIQSYFGYENPTKLIGCLIGQSLLKPEYIERFRTGVETDLLIRDYMHNHPAFIKSRSRLKIRNERFSNKYITTFYNHFLALHWDKYSEVKLEDFVFYVGEILHESYPEVPSRYIKLFTRMIDGNWLYECKTIAGMYKSIQGYEKICCYSYNLDTAFEDLINNYADLQDDFLEFFPSLITFLEGEGIYHKKENLEVSLIKEYMD